MNDSQTPKVYQAPAPLVNGSISRKRLFPALRHRLIEHVGKAFRVRFACQVLPDGALHIKKNGLRGKQSGRNHRKITLHSGFRIRISSGVARAPLCNQNVNHRRILLLCCQCGDNRITALLPECLHGIQRPCALFLRQSVPRAAQCRIIAGGFVGRLGQCFLWEQHAYKQQTPCKCQAVPTSRKAWLAV